MFTICYFLGLVAMSIIRMPYSKNTRTNTIIDNRKTPLEIFLLIVMSIGAFIFPLLYSLSSLFYFADFILPLWAKIFGLCITLIALWLFWRTHKDLGLNWSPSLEIREDHQLIQTGIYQYIRHPMYASALLWGLAQILLVTNWIAGLAPFVSFLVLFLFRVKHEEKMMLDQFGDAYKSYMKTTSRIIPRLF